MNIISIFKIIIVSDFVEKNKHCRSPTNCKTKAVRLAYDVVPVSVIAKVLTIPLSTDFVSIIHYRSPNTQTPTQCLLE